MRTAMTKSQKRELQTQLIKAALVAGRQQGVLPEVGDGIVADIPETARTCRIHFDFRGHPAIAHIQDVGHGDVSVKVALYPSHFANRFMACMGVDPKEMGSAYTQSYVTIQPVQKISNDDNPKFHCALELLEELLSPNQSA